MGDGGGRDSGNSHGGDAGGGKDSGYADSRPRSYGDSYGDSYGGGDGKDSGSAGRPSGDSRPRSYGDSYGNGGGKDSGGEGESGGNGGKPQQKSAMGHDALYALGLLTQLGVSMAACVLIGVLVGSKLDGWLGTAPWMLVLFSFVGAGAAFKAMYDIAIKRWDKGGRKKKQR
ncbi:MAG: AtpZ/AtpI family protein [Clostridiales bacterium]|jgi:ATP synthase protein I|nr:AtpZ/AtpI family protein [Clostridiales bacterium]